MNTLPTMKRIALLTCVAINCITSAAFATDKTLVSWVEIADGTAGSALTLQRGEEFDAIVYAEVAPGRWMAGSDNFTRTQSVQEYPRETAQDTLLQLAIVYGDGKVTIHRNGELVTTYESENIDLISGEDQVVVFGLRHLGGEGHLDARIEDARIYDQALTPDAILALKPNEASDIDPWAWWDFEGEEAIDRTGRFTHVRGEDTATIADGKLLLKAGSIFVMAQSEDAMEKAARGEMALMDFEDYEPETPTMPEDVPDNWLTYHLAHTGPDEAMPGDPNAAIFYEGRYHLHYIYRSIYGYAFAHVSSEDMLHWEWHETALIPPVTNHGMYSGTAFFTNEGKPTIIYHGEGSGRNWVAYGEDKTLDTWSEPVPVIPRNADGDEVQSNNWDPDCWVMDGTYYAISGGGPPQLMKSDDLENWRFLDNLFHDDTDWDALGVKKDEDVSCANMFKIGDKWMLLAISHELGCRYYLGDFKDEKYLPESHHLMNWRGIDYFAPESLLTPDGRRVMWTWVTADFPVSSSQTGIQALPREIELPSDGVLRIRPLRELESLRYDEADEGTLEVAAGEAHRLKKIAGDALELNVTIDPTEAKDYGIKVFCDEEGNGLTIQYLAEKKKLAVGEVQAPLTLEPGEALRLTIYLDKDMVEVFANDRQAIASGERNGYQKPGIELFSNDAEIHADVKGWKMKSTYPKH